MENQDLNNTQVRRNRFEIQGYKGYNDAELANFKFGIRFAYFVCTSLVLIGVLLSNLVILTVAMIIAFVGSFPPYHPFDYLYNHLVRHWLNKPRIPPRSNQGRFACRIATVWLGTTIYLFYIGQDLWGYIAGVLLVFVGTLVSTTDICIPSIIYNFLFSRKAKE